MARRVKTWRWRGAKALSDLLDRIERFPGRRFYDLHLESAALRHRKLRNIVKVRANQHVIRFRAPTARALWRAETLLTKEPATIGWIDSFDQDEVLWDVGANVGIYSLYAAQVKNVVVLAFEPAAHNFALLCDNIRLNCLDDRVTAYSLALSDHSRLGQLNFADDEPGAAEASVEEAGTGLLKQAALVLSIDDFLSDLHLACQLILRSTSMGSS